MKKAFSLVETMVAICVISLGFSAIISIGLAAYSNTAASKTKLKAQTYAQGILENYRAVRDQNGVSVLKTTPTPPASTIDGITFTPHVMVYNINSTSSIVEVTVNWTYKKPESIKSYTLLTNTSARFPTSLPASFTTPTWMP